MDNGITPCVLGLTAALWRKAQGANQLWSVAWMGISDPLPPVAETGGSYSPKHWELGAHRHQLKGKDAPGYFGAHT